MKPLAAGLIAVFVAIPAAGQCVHTNRGQVSGPQALVLFSGGWPDSARCTTAQTCGWAPVPAGSVTAVCQRST